MPGADDQATIGFTIPPSLSAITARYELLAEVGRGGMGIVYKARDRRTGDLVALKAIHPSVAANPAFSERFRNELVLARRITHKNVCRVFDLDEFGSVAVISMEFVDGRSLRDLLRDVESMSPRQGLKIFRQIAAGLGEAHAQGVVHRDLKPENILVGRDGVVKIMDFGIARHVDTRMTATGQVLGTPAYMSPEQAEGKPADARSDIYALGLVLYEMFCGRPAFTAETPVALAVKHLSETPVAPRAVEADLPPRIDEAIRRCLEKQPDKRFQSVADLDVALSGSVATPFELAAVEDAILPDRGRRWQRVDWALIAAATIGMAVFLWCFARVSLAPRSQVSFNRAMLTRIGEQHLERIGVNGAQTRPAAGSLDPGAYVYLARSYGAAKARDLANNPVHYWTWGAAFERGSLEVDNQGRLVSFVRNRVPFDANPPSVDDARREAAKTVENFFGAGAAQHLDRETRGPVYGFVWIGPEIAPGLPVHYSAEVDKVGVASLRMAPDIPPEYSPDRFPFGEVTMNEWGLPLAVLLALAVCAYGFANRRRVSPGARWRLAMTVAGFVVGATQSFASYRFVGIGDMLAIPMGFGALFAAIVYLGSIALEASLKPAERYKLDSFASLFAPGSGRERLGLAILRGYAIGIALLAVDTAALALVISYFGARLSMIHIGLLGMIINTVAWPTGVVWGIASVQFVGVSLLVALTHASASRVRIPSWAAFVGAAAVLAASGIRVSMATVEPWPFTAIVLFVDYAALLAVFRRFDFLTLSVAIGTLGLWWANYTLFVMQQPIGATGPWITFLVWGLGLTAAIALAFRSMIQRGYSRAAAAFQ